MMFSSDMITYVWIRRGLKPGLMFIVLRAHLETVEVRLRREFMKDPQLRWSRHENLVSAQNVVEGCRRVQGGAWAADGRLPAVLDASRTLWEDVDAPLPV